MLKNSWWVRLLAIIIIQALLLTQVDFALSAPSHCRESYQEAALKFQKMTDKSTSLIIGAGCVQYALSGLKLPRLQLESLFSLLGSRTTLSGLISVQENCLVVNNIYKVFTAGAKQIVFSLQQSGVLVAEPDCRGIITRARTEESQAPPIFSKKVVGVLQAPNC
jgi:hypothetical protein